MQVGINIGQNRHFELREALLIYHSSGHRSWNVGGSFVTHHLVEGGKGKRPELGPAKPLTAGFLQSLVKSLGGHVPVEFLPENILARTDRTLAWWTPAQTRPMFFVDSEGPLAEISGRIFPQPPLVWCTRDGALWVRALQENCRPTVESKLAFAPYWNLSESGDVCLGSMRAPGVSTVASIPQWECSFYESEFTHGNVGRVTRHAEGFEGLWRDLAGKEEFPVDLLIELPETIAEFIQPGKERYAF
jgi:PRTRC genetic system protein B